MNENMITKKYTLRKIGKFLLPVAFGVIVANTSYSSEALANDNNNTNISTITKDDLTANIKTLKNEIAKLNQQKQSLELEIKNILANNDNITDNNSIQKLQSQIANLESDVANKEQQLKSLSVDSVVTNIEHSNNQLSTLTDSKETLLNDINRLNEDITKNSDLLASNNDVINNHNTELSTLNNNNSTLNSDIDNLKSELTETTANNKSIENNINALSTEKSNKLSLLDSNTVDINNKKSALSSATNSVSSKQSELDDLALYVDNNSIHISDEVLNKLNNEKYLPWFSLDDNRTPEDKARFEKTYELLKALSNQTYTEVLHNDNTKYDIDNLPKHVQIEISHFANNLLNELRFKNNKSTMKVSEGALTYANKVANIYKINHDDNDFNGKMFDEDQRIDNHDWERLIALNKEYKFKNINKIDTKSNRRTLYEHTEIIAQSNMHSNMLTISEIKEKVYHDLITVLYRFPGSQIYRMNDLLGNRSIFEGEKMDEEGDIYFAVSFDVNTNTRPYAPWDYKKYDSVIRMSKGDVAIRTHFIKIDTGQFTDETEFDKTEIEFKTAKDEYKEKEGELTRLKETEKEKRVELEIAEEKGKEIRGEIVELERKIAEESGKKRDEKSLSDAILEKENKVRENSNKIESINENLLTIRATNDNIDKTLKDLEKAKSDVELELSNIDNNIYKLNDNIKALALEKANIEHNKETLEKTITDLKVEIEKLKSLLNNTMTAKNVLANKNNELNNVIEMLTNKTNKLELLEKELSKRNERVTSKPAVNLINDDNPIIDINEIKDKTPFTSGNKNLVNEDKPTISVEEVLALSNNSKGTLIVDDNKSTIKDDSKNNVNVSVNNKNSIVKTLPNTGQTTNNYTAVAILSVAMLGLALNRKLKK